MDKQPQSLNAALQALLLKRLLLPFLFTTFVVIGLAAFYGGGLVEAQQLRYSQSIGYAAGYFLFHAEHELDAIKFSVSMDSDEITEAVMAVNQQAHGVMDTIYLLDMDRRIRLLAPYDSRYVGLDMSRSEYFVGLDCDAGINYSIPFTSLRTGNPTAYLTLCTDNGEYLVGELNLGALQEAISSAGHPSNGNVFVVDQTGTLLAHPDIQLVEQHVNIGNWEVVKNGLKQDATTIYWRDGNLWVGSASRISPTNWLVITEVPMLLVYAPYAGALVALGLLFLLIFSATVRVFLSQLQQKLVIPLVNLSASADALTNGSYSMNNVDLDGISSFSEIAKLQDDFQKMSRAIQAREALLKENQEQYRCLVEDSPDAIVLHNNSIVLYANTAAIQLYEAENVSQLIGKSIFNVIHDDSRPMVEARLQKLGEKEQVLPLVEQKHVRFNSHVFDAEVITSSIFFAGTYVAQTIIRDITKRKSEEEFLKYRATHDPLTNLPNRFLFQDRLQHALAKSRRNKTPGAVLYLDLDSFKSVNDVFGHYVGDQVLQTVASSLQAILREEDTLARLSGDEFVILLDELKDPSDAEKVANNLIDAFAAPYMVQGKEVSISFSIGISIFPEDGQDTHILLQSADAAMYKAKAEGKRRVKFYAPYMRAQSLERLNLQTQLSRALEDGQLFIQYQPQVDYTTRRIIGVEALVRWQHPKLGLISPGRFIPLAEETGLIIPIGEWILNTVCKQVRTWRDENINIHTAVNLSNLQLQQPNISETIQNAISSSGIPPELLEIELTENIVFQDASSSLDDLFELKSIGVTLAMDDFGAGFSTLGYLAHLPFDRIKLDQHLVANIQNPRDAAVVAGIIAICRNLELELVVEGVETEKQLSFCVSRGCTLFQGWYYSPAVTPSQIAEYVLHGIPENKKGS